MFKGHANQKGTTEIIIRKRRTRTVSKDMRGLVPKATERPFIDRGKKKKRKRQVKLPLNIFILSDSNKESRNS